MSLKYLLGPQGLGPDLLYFAGARSGTLLRIDTS
jgi:hypothetical protein